MKNFEEIYQKALKLAKKHFFSDPSHGMDHVNRTRKLVEYIVSKEGKERGIDLESLRLAVVLHDLGISSQVKTLKKSKDKFKSGEHIEISLRIAENFLKKEGVPLKQIKKIKQIIISHGSHGQEINLEGDILHDADLLDGIGLIGALRKFTFGGQIGRDILGSLEFTKLKLKNRKFRTKTGQKVWEKRVKDVKFLLKKIEEELASKDLV